MPVHNDRCTLNLLCLQCLASHHMVMHGLAFDCVCTIVCIALIGILGFSSTVALLLCETKRDIRGQKEQLKATRQTFYSWSKTELSRFGNKRHPTFRRRSMLCSIRRPARHDQSRLARLAQACQGYNRASTCHTHNELNFEA